MRKAAQEVPLAVDAAPVGAPHRLHPLKILSRILRVKIVELMPLKLRPGRAVQALPPGLQGKVAKPAELSGVPGLPWQHPRHGMQAALLILQSRLEIQVTAALGHGG